MSALGLGEGTPPSKLARNLADSLKYGIPLKNLQKFNRLLAGGTRFANEASVRHIPPYNKGLPSSIEVGPNGIGRPVYTQNHSLTNRRQYPIPNNLLARAHAQILHQGEIRPIYNPEEEAEDEAAAAAATEDEAAAAAEAEAAAENNVAAAFAAGPNISLPANTTIPTKKQRKTRKRKQRKQTRKRKQIK